MATHYQLLEVAPDAPPDDIKRAFRQQIARYHPDKVQHLGEEFQKLAAERAAALTEAYRILSDAGRRAEYDQILAIGAATTGSGPPVPPRPPEPEPPAAPDAGSAASPASTFSEERTRGDEFVRRAALKRFHEAIAREVREADRPVVRGFDVAVVPKRKLFGRSSGPLMLARFVAQAVDGPAVADAWTAALNWRVPAHDEICVFVVGSAGMAPARELAEVIAGQRRRTTRGVKLTLVPVDARDWHAHIPTDAPPLVRALLDHLKPR